MSHTSTYVLSSNTKENTHAHTHTHTHTHTHLCSATLKREVPLDGAGLGPRARLGGWYEGC
jgi:hypothetical protein